MSDQPQRCELCLAPTRFTVEATRHTALILDPEPSQFGWIALEQPAHGGRELAYPLQGMELADARAHGDPLFVPHGQSCPKAFGGGSAA